MATFNVAAGAVAKHNLALAANVEDTVVFTDDADQVEVLVLTATQPVFFTVDGTAATINGANCYIVTSGSAVSIDRPSQATTGPTVRLISAAAATVSVQRA